MKQIQAIGLTLCLAFASLGSGLWPVAAQPGVQPSPINASLVQLIANPKVYDGKVVRLIGFCHLEFEGDALYLHQEDFDRGISRNGIWLNTPSDKRGLSDQYVLIEGVFEDADNEFEAGFSGKLTRIFRMERWPGRKEMPKVLKK